MDERDGRHNEDFKITQDVTSFDTKKFPRVPARYLDGTASLVEYVAYLQTVDAKNEMSMGDYMILTDWVGKLAELLNIPVE